MNLNKLEKEIQKDFQEKFGERLGTLEFSYQNHGGSAWNDITIPEFISSALKKQRNLILEMIEEEKTKCKACGKDADSDHVWNNSGYSAEESGCPITKKEVDISFSEVSENNALSKVIEKIR